MKPKQLIVQAGEVVYCDAAGIALLVEYRQIQEQNEGQIEIRDLRPQFQQLMALFEIDHLVSPPELPGPVANAVHNTGRMGRRPVLTISPPRSASSARSP